MQIKVTTFKLREMSLEEYERTCDQLAHCFANIEGLLKKYWLKNSSENLYGCIYIWEDIKYMEAFSKTELFKVIANHPNFENIINTDFEVIEYPAKITRGINNYLENKIKKKSFETNQEI